MASKKYKTIDLFAGCGGLMDGFMQEGAFETLACVEWEKFPCETLIKRLKDRWRHNNAEKEVVRFDIQRTEELINGFDDEIQDIDFLLEPPTHAAFAENLNKAMFTYSGLFNTSSGVVDMDVIVVDNKKYMRILFNTSPTYVTYVLTYARSTEHKYYINDSLIDEVNYTYEV